MPDLENASPGELVMMLYDRAVRDLRKAFNLLSENGSQEHATHLIVHAQQIIAELKHSLNLQEGGELAENLSRLYEYMQFRLTEAVSEKDAVPVSEVISLMQELHDAWKTMLQD